MIARFWRKSSAGLIPTAILIPTLFFGAENRPLLIIEHHSNQTSRTALDLNGPIFIAYSDGTVLWRKNGPTPLDLFLAASSTHTAQIAKKLTDLITQYDGKLFTLTRSSDPEVTTILCGKKQIIIKGTWEKPMHLESYNADTATSTAWENKIEKEMWLTLPDAIRDALNETVNLEDKDAKVWRPNEIKVLLAPAGPRLGNPVIWPKNWPKSFSPLRGNASISSINLPGDMLGELLNLVSIDGKPVVILLDGQSKFATVRFIFPGEPFWAN